MYTILKINCEDQSLKVTEKPKIASGGINEDKIVFTFSEHWIGYSKTALFERDDSDDAYEAVIDENNECIIPSVVTGLPGYVHVSVYGTRNGSTRTSDFIKFKVIRGALTGSNVVVTWDSVRPLIISSLNEKFNSELPETSTTQEIIEYINSIDNSVEIKTLFISMLNYAARYINDITGTEFEYTAVPLITLTIDMTDDELASAIDNNFYTMSNTAIYYLGVMEKLDEMVLELDGVTQIGGNTARDVRLLANDIFESIRQIKNSYDSFRWNIIGYVADDDGEFYLDGASSDSDIISVVNQKLSNYDDLLSGMEAILDISQGGNA